jgi:hypothetical protein
VVCCSQRGEHACDVSKEKSGGGGARGSR